MTMPTVYLVLGLPGSGRREVVLELIEGGLPEARAITIYHAVNDVPPPADVAAQRLAERAGVTLVPYTFSGGMFGIESGRENEEEAEAVFFIMDGRAPVIDQLEVFPAWLRARRWEIGRVLLVVHCALAAAHPEVAEWHEACVHFADCVLLNRRDPAAQAWTNAFRKQFAAERYPCLFAFVKEGRLENAPLLLFPEARRMAQLFDEQDPLDDLDLDEDELPDEPFSLEAAPDPYFEWMPTGQRRRPVPNVTKYL